MGEHTAADSFLMRAKRKGPPLVGPTRAGKRSKGPAGLPIEAPGTWGSAVWQDPPHPILEHVFDALLAQPCGKRWVSARHGPWLANPAPPWRWLQGSC